MANITAEHKSNQMMAIFYHYVTLEYIGIGPTTGHPTNT